MACAVLINKCTFSFLVENCSKHCQIRVLYLTSNQSIAKADAITNANKIKKRLRVFTERTYLAVSGGMVKYTKCLAQL